MDVKIAVIGQNGDGKSSFINKVLGEDVAQVSFTEKSEEIVEEYLSPLNDSIKFYEIPAITGLEFNRDNFFEKANFPTNRYDYVFFITKDKRSSDDYFLLQELQKRQFPFSILRTHIDEVVDKARNRAQGSNVEENMVLEQTRQTMKDKMESRGVNSEAVEIHLIDNSVPSNFDFQAAIRQMQDSLPDQKAQLMQGTLLSVLSNECSNWSPIRVDIAVVGQSRHGKSSLINAIVGSNVAEVGHIGSVANEVQQYSIPNHPNINLYDVPGISSTDCTRKEFDAKAKLHEIKYDLFFMVTRDVFNDDCEFIRQKISKKKKPFLIVRTHVDQTVDRFCSTVEPLQSTEKRICAEIRENLGLQLRKLGAESTQIYLVDLRRGKESKFDFPQLMEDIGKELIKVKRQAFLLSVTSFDPNMIEAKYNELWRTIFDYVLVSGAAGLIPIQGVNLSVNLGTFVAATVEFLCSFRLTKEEIAAQEKRQRLKRGLIEDKLVAFMQKQEFEILMAIRKSLYCKEGLIAASNRAAKIGAAIKPILGRILGLATVDEIIKATEVFVVVGMMVGSISSCRVTLYLLQKELKNAKECALHVSSLIQPTGDHS